MTSAKVIPGLTGLRGIAACWVVLYHLFPKGPSPIRFGYLGVDVFFILSGFVLSYVYARQFENTDAATYFSFIKARVARIFPLHFFMLLVVAGAVLFLPGFAAAFPNPHDRFGLSAFIAEAFLIQNWFHWMPLAWNGPAWSLSAEWAAYLFFPVFVMGTQRWRSIAWTVALAFVSIAVLVGLLLAKGVPTPEVTGAPGMVRMAMEFCCGCLLFRAGALGLPDSPRWLEAVALAVLGTAFYVPGAIYLAAFGVALVVHLSSQDNTMTAKALSLRPLVFLGEISYSIYLVHWIVIQVSTWAAGTWFLSPLQTLGVLSMTLVLSYLTYSQIELRARAWARKLGTKNRIAPVTALAES